MDGWCVEWMAEDFFLVGISRRDIIPLAAIAIPGTGPTPSHDTTAVYPIPKSVSPPLPLSPYPLLTITHPEMDLRLGP